MDEALLAQLTKHVNCPQEARRLWRRVHKLMALGLVAQTLDVETMELACWAMHLSPRGNRDAIGKARPGLKERAQQAAELLTNVAGDSVKKRLLDRATRILEQLPLRSTRQDEARLLADAINLEDFSVAGLVRQAATLTPEALAQSCRTREQYGYWDARLRDGFHFEAVRQLARQRLLNVRQVAQLLEEELKEDQP